MAKQRPGAGHESDVRSSKVPLKSWGAGARAAVHCPPEYVSITLVNDPSW